MHAPVIFTDLFIIFLVSVPVAIICLRLKLPILVGFMLTGILIGPFGLGLITELEVIETLAEIGVMLLLFTIGLEFSIGRLRKMRNLIVIGGSIQAGLTIAVTAVIAVAFGRPLNQAVFFGFLVTLSSTAIVLKSYSERNELNSPHGRAGVGILLFQDISVVLMMLIVPALGGTGEAGEGSPIYALGVSLVALVAIVGVAWVSIPKILEQVVKLRNPELLLLTAALISLGTAWITLQFGLSLALGAFIAGVVLSESEYSHQITADILPFRDVFNSVFFVSMGLLLSLGALYQNIGSVLLLVIVLIVGKALIILMAVRFLGFPLRIAVMTGLGLAQIGEFSFVLAKAGQGTELLPGADYQIFLAASILSMIATPLLISFAPRVGYFAQSFISDKKHIGPDKESGEDIHVTSSGGLTNHVIIVGYGLSGQLLSRVLRTALVPYTILELNAEVVRRVKARGEKINYGDATRRRMLIHAGISEANVLVLAMSDAPSARRAVSIARQLNKDLYIIVRTQYTSEVNELMQLGANEVIPFEFETSIEIFARVLGRYGVVKQIIDNQITQIRGQSYEMLRAPSVPPENKLTDLTTALRTAATDTFELDPTSSTVGQTLSQIDLRGRTGASVIAVTNNGETMVNPGADFVLQAGSSLVLWGDSEQIEVAEKLLGPEKVTPEDD
jgi:CPA2 family monovalent cation:H+ antiporter-2